MKLSEVLHINNRGKHYKIVGGNGGDIWECYGDDLYLVNKCKLVALPGASIAEVFSLGFVITREFEEVK